MRRSQKPPAKIRRRRDAEIPAVPTVAPPDTAANPTQDDRAETAAEEAVRRMVEAAYT